MSFDKEIPVYLKMFHIYPKNFNFDKNDNDDNNNDNLFSFRST